MIKGIVIKSSKRDKFIKESDDNVITNDFLNQCRESSKIIKRKSK